MAAPKKVSTHVPHRAASGGADLFRRVPVAAACRVAVTALVLCAAACRNATPAAPPGTLVVALESAPAILDPRYATDANSSLVAALVATGLTTTGARVEPAPDLASGWRERSPVELELSLREGARFHDGTPVTAGDVAATYRSVLDPVLRSPKREALAVIEAIETPDDRTVVLRLREPTPSLLDALSLGILPARLTAEGPLPPATVIGAGPFRVAGALTDGGVVLAPHRTDAGGPSIPELRFRVVPDGVVRALELVSGEVHLVQNGVEPDLIPWLGRQPGLEVVTAPGTTFQYLGVSFRDRRLADRRVRTALARAVDRDGVIHHLLRDTARTASGMLSPGHWAYEPDVVRHDFDPPQARRLLAEAGLDGDAELRRFSYKTSTVELRRRIAEAFQADLARIGLGLDVRSYEWATFYADIRRGAFEVYSLAWVGVRDPELYYRLFHSRMTPPAGNNRGGYANATMDGLLDAARHEVDRERRRHLYGEVQRLAAEDLPIIPLWWSDNVVVKSRALEGFTPAPDGDLRSLATATFGRS
jgi:peptide/nickel transport system substrate-binding protein